MEVGKREFIIIDGDSRDGTSDFYISESAAAGTRKNEHVEHR